MGRLIQEFLWVPTNTAELARGFAWIFEHHFEDQLVSAILRAVVEREFEVS